MVEFEKKENFSEWYNQVIRQAEIIDDRFPVKGMPVYPNYGFSLIKNIFSILENKLDNENFKQIWIPILIPKEIFQKEEEHIAGFGKEVFYVRPGNPIEEEKETYYILRPTSETELYYMFSLWINSYKDLPLLTYMTNSVYRYETKATKPLIRGREILWIESHTAHKDIDDAKRTIKKSMEIYSYLFWDKLSIPHIWVVRPDWDKFAGAEKTFAADTILPDGRFLQIGTTHMLGQKFSKAFDIKFQDKHPYVKISDNCFEARSKDGKYRFIINILDENTIEIKFYDNNIEKAKIIEKINFSGEISEDNEELIKKINEIINKNFPKEFLDLDHTKYVWQTCFGVSMRLLAAVIGIHGDNNGLVLPFDIAPIQIVIIPIYYSDAEKIEVINYCKKLKDILSKYRILIDDREDKTPGWKFNYWELKGVPIRIEIGLREVKNNNVTVFDRISKNRKIVSLDDLQNFIDSLIKDIDYKLKENSKKFFESSIVKVVSIEELKEILNNKKVAKVPFCLKEECGRFLKENLNIDVRGYDIIPESAENMECIVCKNKAKYWCYVGKSY